MNTLVVTGTGTGVGKTVVSAMLTLALGGQYWKPIQSGTDGGTDRERVAALTGLPDIHFRPERYVLSEPLSPHRAAEIDGVDIDLDKLTLPQPSRDWLIVEGAGGVLVPLNRRMLMIDLFAKWGAPVIVVASTRLGTINHTLLTLEALKRRAIPVFGLVFTGEAKPDSERTIAEFGDAKILGRVPLLPELDARSLRETFATHFKRSDFEMAP